MVSLSPEFGALFQFRSKDGNSTTMVNKPDINAPYWLKLVREGNKFTGYYSTDGQKWTKHNSINIEMAQTTYIGLAVSSNVPTLSCSATFDNIEVTGTNVGGLLREWWTNITGTNISDLTSASNYPANPTGSQVVSNFSLPVEDWADNYGSKISGYLYPTQTGYYHFWIAGNDNAELWLSTDTSKTNIQRIAYLSGETQRKEWDKYPEQASGPIELIAGGAYYIEALHKEGEGDDHMAVAWSGPGIEPQIIHSEYVSPQLEKEGNSSGTNLTDRMLSQDIIFPNPTSNYLTISLPSEIQNIAQIDIFTISGVKVLSKKINSENPIINVKEIAQGVYILKLSCGNKTYINRFIKN
jgi:hypothetical protein